MCKLNGMKVKLLCIPTQNADTNPHPNCIHSTEQLLDSRYIVERNAFHQG